MPLHLSPVCINAIKNEQERKFMQTLYTSYMRAMYLTAYRLTHNAADAEDVVSASCVALIKHIDTLQTCSQKAVSAYVLTTVRNQSLILLKRRNVELRLITKMKEESVLHAESPPPDDELQQYYHRSLAEVLEIIRYMPEQDQMLLQMRFFDQVSYAEMSHLLNMQQSTLRTKVSRARRRLLKLLKEKQDEE